MPINYNHKLIIVWPKVFNVGVLSCPNERPRIWIIWMWNEKHKLKRKITLR